MGDRDDARRAGTGLDPAETDTTTEEATAAWTDRTQDTEAGGADGAARRADPDVVRDGGPTRHRGAPTTTGGRAAGPASVHRRPRRPGGKVAPTTTGDATTGGTTVPTGGTTSDQSGQVPGR